MGIKNIFILFVSTTAISLVVFTVVFSLFFKNVDLTFDTKEPESAPGVVNTILPGSDNKQPAKFQSTGVSSADLKVPPEFAPRPAEDDDDATEPEEDVKLAEQPENDIQRTPFFSRNEDSETKDTEPPTPVVVMAQAPVALPAPPPGPQPLKQSKKAQKAMYQVYLDGFSSESAARKKIQQLQGKGVQAFVATGRGRYVIKLGTFSSKSSAKSWARKLGAKVKKL
ncbi:MAG: hypothetical protein KTR14_09210 [Vampirovibrio sp.]|nr:hypothetical protein [Vampirovibrio sp.]